MNGFFIDTFFLPWFGVDLKQKKAKIVGDGSQPVSFTHRKDVGRLMAQMILNNEFAPVIRLGPETKTLNEAFKMYEDMKKVKIDMVREPVPAVKSRVQKAEGDQMDRAVDALKIIIAEGNGLNKKPLYDGKLGNFITIKEYFEKV